MVTTSSGGKPMPDRDINPDLSDSGNLQKDPEDWVTGDETMTAAQASYLKTLSQEAGVSFDDNLTKAEASKKIEELQARTGRGIDH
jgi:hypothetical protein